MNNSTPILKRTIYAPTFSSLIQNRSEAIVIVGAGALQIGLYLAGVPGWACPIKSLFGIPCPGCGLTMATSQLLHGQLGASIHTHAFASIFLFAFLLMAIAIFLPEKHREATALWIAGFERRSGITSLVLIALLVYWAIRLVGLI